MSGQRRIVKNGISLTCLLILLSFLNRANFSSHKKEVANPTSKKKSAQRLTHKNNENLQRSNSYTKKESIELSKECNKVHKTYLKLKSEKRLEVAHWENIYLIKDGVNFVIRIVKDTNAQDIEIERLKFYSLDEEGFPNPVTGIHNKILHSRSQLRSILSNYTVKERTEISSLPEAQILLTRTNGKLTQIVDQNNSLQCTFKI